MIFFSSKHIVSTVAAIMLTVLAYAQPACPAVNAGPDVVLPCGSKCTTLTATPLVTGATTSYGVAQITYSPQPYAGTQVLANQDDRFSAVIDLPFNFCFFGTVYNKVVIGANGIVSFNTANAGAYNNYQIIDPLPNNIPPEIQNGILAPWQDIDPELNGAIYYQIIGTAPCRMFVASWDSVPYFGSPGSKDGSLCPTTIRYASNQVILYETTNIIDILIRNKDFCDQQNSGNAIEGIVNAGGNAYAVVPGRNKTQWTAQDDAWRFSPNGTPNYVTKWYDGSTEVGTGDVVQVCLNTQLQVTYTARTTYTPCDGSQDIVVTDDVLVSRTGSLISGIDSAHDVSCAGLTNGEAWAYVSGGVGTVTYGWSDQNGPIAGSVGQLHITDLATGTYYFTATDNTNCVQVDSVVIGVSSVNTLVSTPIATNATCFRYKNGSIDANPSGGTGLYSFSWSFLNGTPINGTEQILKGLGAESYRVTVSDNLGCSVVATASITEPAELKAQVNPGDITPVKCKGDENATMIVTTTGGTPKRNSSATQDFQRFYSADSNGLITRLPAGDYTVVVFDDKGCQTSIQVSVPDALPDNFDVFVDSTSCYGPEYNDGNVRVVYQTFENGPYQFSLDSGQQQFSGEFLNLSAGSHTVTAVNNNGCVTQIPVLIPEPLPIVVDVNPDSVFIALGGSQQVEVTQLNATNPYYEWTPSLGLSCIDCPNPVVSAYESGDYVITVNMLNRNEVCHGSATLHVEVLPHKPVFVPNSFTPNGDFNNDEFRIFGEGIKAAHLKVFNRWGELMFDTSNQFDGWDGTYRGTQLAPQVFTYHVIVTFLDNEQVEKRGSVTLLR